MLTLVSLFFELAHCIGSATSTNQSWSTIMPQEMWMNAFRCLSRSERNHVRLTSKTTKSFVDSIHLHSLESIAKSIITNSEYFGADELEIKNVSGYLKYIIGHQWTSPDLSNYIELIRLSPREWRCKLMYKLLENPIDTESGPKMVNLEMDSDVIHRDGLIELIQVHIQEGKRNNDWERVRRLVNALIPTNGLRKMMQHKEFYFRVRVLRKGERLTHAFNPLSPARHTEWCLRFSNLCDCALRRWRDSHLDSAWHLKQDHLDGI